MKPRLLLPLLALAPLLPQAASAGISPDALSNNARPPLVQEQQVEGGYVYQSSCFIFSCPLKVDMGAMEAIARLFENTREACTALPLGFSCNQGRYRVTIYRNREEFVASIGSAYAGVPGVYMQGCILLPAETLGLEAVEDKLLKAPGKQPDTDAIIHELAHQLTLRGNTWDTPTWLGEGLAEYLRLATDGEGKADMARVQKAIAPYVAEGRRLGREFPCPPLEQFMSLSRAEFNSARGRAGQFNYAMATLLTWYFLHLDGEGDGAALSGWMQQLRSTPRATAHLRWNLPENATPEQVAAERQRLMQLVASIRENYHYAPLLHGRSWQELEAELATKVEHALGIRLHFPNPHP